MLCFFSAVALTAYKTNPDHEENRESLEGYGLHHWDDLITAHSSVSLFLSALASLAHISRNNAISRRFVGTIYEGATALLIGLPWGVSLLMLTDATKGLAVSGWDEKSNGEIAGYQQIIYDGNLYFSSWGCTICALVLFSMCLGEQRRKVLRCFKISGIPDGISYHAP